MTLVTRARGPDGRPQADGGAADVIGAPLARPTGLPGPQPLTPTDNQPPPVLQRGALKPTPCTPGGLEPPTFLTLHVRRFCGGRMEGPRSQRPPPGLLPGPALHGHPGPRENLPTGPSGRTRSPLGSAEADSDAEFGMQAVYEGLTPAEVAQQRPGQPGGAQTGDVRQSAPPWAQWPGLPTLSAPVTRSALLQEDKEPCHSRG